MLKVGLASLGLTLCMLLTACDLSRTNAISDYQTLCEIYEEIVPLDIGGMEKILRIGDRISSEIPNFEKHYNELAYVPADEVYPLTQKIAEYETGEKWECPSMQAFYSGDTD